ncbi:hypothetical protein LCGC14_1760340 [marine sediment metagenome]|uniref:Phage tail collar domain-containing protein n=1 Tax=marine sediment metagenome TaxID=412755 RepID=A0A0F9JGC7_9ZZZZ
MDNIPVKIAGNQLTAVEYNNAPQEAMNAVTTSGQLLGGDKFQVSRAMAIYAATGTYYTDSGAVNAYVLNLVSPRKGIIAYDVGTIFRFIPGNTNTTASTINVISLGLKNLKDIDGNDLLAGEIIAGKLVEAFYDGTDVIVYNNGVHGSEFTTGDVKTSFAVIANSGWVIMDDGTIGNAASLATTRANADTVSLFTLLWDNTADAQCPVLPGGRGASAAADFAANKTLTLPRTLGRAIACAGAGSGLTARVLAEFLGEETHQTSIAETAAHIHPSAAGAITLSKRQGDIDFVCANTGAETGSTGGDTPHNNMQPSSFMNLFIKL